MYELRIVTRLIRLEVPSWIHCIIIEVLKIRSSQVANWASLDLDIVNLAYQRIRFLSHCATTVTPPYESFTLGVGRAVDGGGEKMRFLSTLVRCFK